MNTLQFLFTIAIFTLTISDTSSFRFTKKKHQLTKTTSKKFKKPEGTITLENVTVEYCYELMQNAGYAVYKKLKADQDEYKRKEKDFMVPIAYETIGLHTRKNIWITSIDYRNGHPCNNESLYLPFLKKEEFLGIKQCLILTFRVFAEVSKMDMRQGAKMLPEYNQINQNLAQFWDDFLDFCFIEDKSEFEIVKSVLAN